MRIVRFVTLLLLMSACASFARAEKLYTFSLTPTVEYDNNLIQPFSFSLLVPNFIAADETPALTPFTITDGTYSATIAQGVAHNDGTNSCFAFGTAANVTIYSNCGTLIGPGGAVVGFYFSNQTLPTEDGTYTASGTATLMWGEHSDDYSQGTGTLVITTVATPEPASAILAGTTLLGLAFATRKRPGRS